MNHDNCSHSPHYEVAEKCEQDKIRFENEESRLKIYFNIPFTEYFFAKDTIFGKRFIFCLARKVFIPIDKEQTFYKFVKV